MQRCRKGPAGSRAPGAGFRTRRARPPGRARPGELSVRSEMGVGDGGLSYRTDLAPLPRSRGRGSYCVQLGPPRIRSRQSDGITVEPSREPSTAADPPVRSCNAIGAIVCLSGTSLPDWPSFEEDDVAGLDDEARAAFRELAISCHPRSTAALRRAAAPRGGEEVDLIAASVDLRAATDIQRRCGHGARPIGSGEGGQIADIIECRCPLEQGPTHDVCGDRIAASEAFARGLLKRQLAGELRPPAASLGDEPVSAARR